MKFDKAISEFIAYAKTQPNAEWKSQSLWDDGWRIELAISQRFIRMEPKTARKLFRYLDEEWRRAFRKTPAQLRDPAKEKEILGWLEHADKVAKAALHLARQGMVPAS